MITCHLCGETIEEHSMEGMGIKCPGCGSHYCGRCSITIFNCLKCGRSTEGFDKNFVEDVSEPTISMVNMRRSPREKHSTTVEYIVAPLPGSNEPWKRVRALTKDISEGGLCIFTKMSHKEGERVRFSKCTVCGDKTMAEIRWVKKVEESVYMAGLVFY